MSLVVATACLAFSLLVGVYSSTVAFARGDVPGGCWWFAFSTLALIGGVLPWLR